MQRQFMKCYVFFCNGKSTLVSVVTCQKACRSLHVAVENIISFEFFTRTLSIL